MATKQQPCLCGDPACVKCGLGPRVPEDVRPFGVCQSCGANLYPGDDSEYCEGCAPYIYENNREEHCV